MRRFAKAVLLGALAGGALPSLLTIGLAAMMLPDVVQGAYGPWQATSLIILPFVVSFAIVLVSATFIGLPVAALLRRLRWESQEAYCVIGAAAGAIVPLLLLALTPGSDGHWLALLGAVSGGVTGYAWGRPARRTGIGPSNRHLTPPGPLP